MKKLLSLFIILIIFCAGCTRQKNTQAASFEPDSDQVTETISEVAVETEQAPVIEETQEEKRKQFESMTILDIIDIFIDENNLIPVCTDEEFELDRYLGVFKFSSRESIEWYSYTSGPRHFPRLYIIDENNIKIEVFNYYGSAEKIRPGNYCSANKHYINISKDQLINFNFRIKMNIESYVTTEYFKTSLSEEQEKERRGFFFYVLKDTPIYEDNTVQGTELGMIFAENMVKVIDMHYQNMSDRYPAALKIEFEKLSGWVDLESIDFILEVPDN